MASGSWFCPGEKPFTFASQDYGESERKPFQVAQMKQSMKYLFEKKPISTDHGQQMVICQTRHLWLKLDLWCFFVGRHFVEKKFV